MHDATGHLEELKEKIDEECEDGRTGGWMGGRMSQRVKNSTRMDGKKELMSGS